MKINKKVVLLSIAIVAVVALLFSQSAIFPVGAQKSKLADLLKIDPNAQKVTAEVIQDFSNSKTIDKKQADKNMEVVAKAKKLIGKAEKEYLTEGWLHIFSNNEAFVTAQKTFADGTPIPTKWTTDLWILLDKKGDAIRAVTIQDTGDPKLLQISIYQNGAWKNISLGTTEEPTVYHPTFSDAMLATMSNYKDLIKFSAESSVVNGQETIVFSTQEDLKTLVSDGKDKPKDAQMYGFVTKYYYAAVSGLPVQDETYKINSAGALEILRRDSTKIIEKVSTPPANILAYFTK